MFACDAGIFEEGEVAITSTHGREGLAALFEGVDREKLLVLDSEKLLVLDSKKLLVLDSEKLLVLNSEKLLVLDSVGDTSDVTLACGDDGASSTPLSPNEFLLLSFGEGMDGETELMLDETLKKITTDITFECRVILVENLKSML